MCWCKLRHLDDGLGVLCVFSVALSSSFILQRPMLFIDTIAIYSWIHYWDTCTTYMLVTIHKEQLEEGKNNINKCKRKESNYANILHYMHRILMDCCYPS
jgi:hypothetical protein